MMNETRDSYSLESIRDYIRQEKFKTFVLCSDKFSYYICPLKRKCVYEPQTGRKSYVTYRYGAIYDNVDRFGKQIFTKDEMCIRFLMNFGHEVKYYFDDEDDRLKKL